jgi:hypothetical protein
VREGGVVESGGGVARGVEVGGGQGGEQAEAAVVGVDAPLCEAVRGDEVRQRARAVRGGLCVWWGEERGG